jgi:phosphoesterase RecJ-like protein
MPAELTPKQQWSEAIKSASSVLILTHAKVDGDAIGSSLALKLGLEKLGKQVTLHVSEPVPDYLSFLPGLSGVSKTTELSKDLMVIVDESQAKVGNVNLKRLSETKLALVVSPKGGLLTASNVRIEEGAYKFDLIIVLDSSNLERVGSIYEQNPDLFYEVPVINIDHHAGNTNFGKINIVDITASSTAEILVSLMETIAKDLPNGIFDADIATSLLTGLITDTKSFQNLNTTPKAFTVAAQLVAAGGRQQDIVNHIYKNRSLSTLRLWGRALAYIKEDKPLRFAWSVLSKADFVAAQAKQDESSGVIDELLKTAIGMDFVLLLTDRDNTAHGSFRAINPSCDVSLLARLFGGGGHPQAAAFTLENCTVQQKEAEIIQTIKNHLTGRKEQPPSTPVTPTETPTPAPASTPIEEKPLAGTQEEPRTRF